MTNLQVVPWPVASPPSGEEWRDVAGFESEYQVSSLGHVRRRDTGHILRPWIAAKSYHYVCLSIAGRKKRVGVHVLVAEAFHGAKPSALHEVAHHDGVGTNNTAQNLRWATHAENVQDQRRHGTLRSPVMRGAAHPRAKLTSEDVIQIRHTYSHRRGRLTELAARFAVNRSTVKRVAVGANWAQI